MLCRQVYLISGRIQAKLSTKNGEQSYWHNGEQFKTYHCCNVLSYVCQLSFMVRNANDSAVVSKCCECPSPIGNAPLLVFLDPKLLLDPSTMFVLVSVISDKKGVTRTTQV